MGGGWRMVMTGSGIGWCDGDGRVGVITAQE